MDSSEDESYVDISTSTDQDITSASNFEALSSATLVENNVSSKKLNFVPVKSDTVTTDFQKQEAQVQTVPVQNICGILNPVSKESFIYNTSDDKIDFDDNSDSVSYVARDVEQIDCLNFDDSDVSIDEDD